MLKLKGYTAGIVMKLLNLCLFTCMSIFSLHLSSSISLIQAFFIVACIACFFMLLFLLYMFLLYGNKEIFKLHDVKLSVIRSLFNVIGMLYWLEALRCLGGNDATAIGYMTPIFTLILAYIFCNEIPTFEIVGAILVGFLGMYIIVQPTLSHIISYGAAFGIISALGLAMHDVLCKKQTLKEHYATQSFYQFLNIAIITAPFALYNWTTVSSSDVLYITLMAFVSVFNVIVLFFAYKLAPVMVLMPFSYCRLIFMAVATYALFGDVPSQNSIVGAVIISIASSYIFYTQSKMKVTKGIVSQENV